MLFNVTISSTFSPSRRYEGGMRDNATRWEPRVRRARTWATISLAVLCLSALVAGCSSSGTGTPTPTAPTTSASTSPSSPPSGGNTVAPAYCPAAAKLKASVQALTSLNPSGGLAGVQSAIDNIQASVNEFAAASKAQFGPQVSQLKTQLTKLQAAVTAAGASPSANTIGAVATAATGVVSAYTALNDAISNRCG